MDRKVKVGLIGLGTVGSGTYKTLQGFENIEVAAVAVRDRGKKRNIPGFDTKLFATPDEVVNNPEIDIVVELIGGVEPAFGLLKTAIKNGKHIVTANKELLAKHGEELFALAEKHNRAVLYEAAIAGGIPVITPLKTILAGNKITKIEAILNGTTNYILTKMDAEKASYADVLKEAQQLGYAEADPTSDVEGFDAAYKITTLATLAFGQRVKVEDVYREGITKISADDINAANELGYKVKLVAAASIDEKNNADVRVHPMLIPKKSTLAHIDFVTNAVMLKGEPVGEVTLSGPGAGEGPTASSVVGDILMIAADIDAAKPVSMMRCRHNRNANVVNINDTVNKYYLSINTPHAKGVIGKIGDVFAKNDISIASILQKEVCGSNASIIVITEKTAEKNVQKAIKSLGYDINSLIRVSDAG